MNLFRMRDEGFRRPSRGGGSSRACGWARARQGTLTMNGQVVSTDLRTLGGGPYVRLGDIAKALGMVIVKRPGGYEFRRPAEPTG